VKGELELDLARRLFPRLLFDLCEPFFPRWIGASLFRHPAASPSFRRELVPPPGGCVIEYAIYWDWDIQHLYDLEHIWLYLGPEGRLSDAEASFHGRWLKAIAPGFDNFEGGSLSLFSQPGKHAFAPGPGVFRLLPDCETSTWEDAGKAGAEVPWPLRDRVRPDPSWDRPVRRHLSKRRFRPSWEFRPWTADRSIIIEWRELDALLPGLFREGLAAAGVP
jgi:hypothetical protein